jgi:hypothetical protein
MERSRSGLIDMWTKDRHILKVEPGDGPANGISTCVSGGRELLAGTNGVKPPA